LEMLYYVEEGCNRPVGIMVPIPQCPLYSTILGQFNQKQINYYLDEENGWTITEAELMRSFNENKDKYFIRAIVLINPGNPAGQVLSEDEIKTIIKFAKANNLFIISDEVYQINLYNNSIFYSFKRILHDMGPSYSDSVELASFMSSSKGIMAESGLRGGYCEIINMEHEAQVEFKKLLSGSSSAPTTGQLVMDLVVSPPNLGEASHELYEKEKKAILTSLSDKADFVTHFLSSLMGIECKPINGGYFAFPKLNLPLQAIEEAKRAELEPDVFYCKQLLEATGICVAPGSFFGQKEGTYHFRFSIIEPIEVLKESLELFKEFHLKFLDDCHKI